MQAAGVLACDIVRTDQGDGFARGAAVLGFVGAGGIGQTLLEVIRKFYYADVSALLVLIIATVMLIDAVTERVRHRLLGQERQG